MTTKTTVPLDSEQMFLLDVSARREISRRYEIRNAWLHPIGSSPARPDYAVSAREEIRALIAAVRTLDKAKHRAWHRESLRKAA